jgi:hypothetical protein
LHYHGTVFALLCCAGSRNRWGSLLQQSHVRLHRLPLRLRGLERAHSCVH